MHQRLNGHGLDQVNGHDLYVSPNMLLALDIDESLIRSTRRDSQQWQRDLLKSLFIKLAGGVVAITGRDFDGVDETFDLPYVSVEHDAAQRVPIIRDGRVERTLIENVRRPDTAQIAADLKEALKGRFSTYALGQPFQGKGIVIESKHYTNAVIHFETLDGIEIQYLEDAAKEVHAAHKLEGSHVVKPGRDAVEITVYGRDKATALRGIQKNPYFEDRVIVALGDSNPDALMMEIALETGGNGIAVGNGIHDTDTRKNTNFITHRARGIDNIWQYLQWLDQHPALNEVPVPEMTGSAFTIDELLKVGKNIVHGTTVNPTAASSEFQAHAPSRPAPGASVPGMGTGRGSGVGGISVSKAPVRRPNFS